MKNKRPFHALFALTLLSTYALGNWHIFPVHFYVAYIAVGLLLAQLLFLSRNAFFKTIPAQIRALRTTPTPSAPRKELIHRALLIGLLLSLLATGGSGLMMEKGRHLMGLFTPPQTQAAAQPQPLAAPAPKPPSSHLWHEMHETASTLFLLFALSHIVWTWSTKRAYARHMLFLPTAKKKTPPAA